MMREHENGRMVRRIVAPPPFPRIVLPRTPNRPKHIAAQNPCAYIFERLNGKIVIDAFGPAALTEYLLEYLRSSKPRVELGSANPEGIVQILPGASAIPIK